MNILILGDKAVGKNYIASLIVDNSIPDRARPNGSYYPGDKKYIKIKTKSKIINTNIIVPSVYSINFYNYILFNEKKFQDYHCFILVFDLSNEDSLNSIESLFTGYEKNIFLDSPLVLFGNKCDLSSKIKDPEDFAQKYNLKYFETSAINNINVKEGFKELVIDILKKYGNKFDKPMELKKNKKKERYDEDKYNKIINIDYNDENNEDSEKQFLKELNYYYNF